MAWVTPHAWVPGEVATAAQLNQDLRDNPLWLYSGRPSLSLANGTIGVNGGTPYIAGVMGTIDCLFTTDSALDCWDQNWGFTPTAGSIALPQTGYYWMNGYQNCVDSVVGAEHVVRLLYEGTIVAVQSYGSTASFGPVHSVAMLHKCVSAAGLGGTAKMTYRRGGSGTLTTWFTFQAQHMRGV
jgi:hypothetical protein